MKTKTLKRPNAVLLYRKVKQWSLGVIALSIIVSCSSSHQHEDKTNNIPSNNQDQHTNSHEGSRSPKIEKEAPLLSIRSKHRQKPMRVGENSYYSLPNRQIVIPPIEHSIDREKYQSLQENAVISTSENAFSTFSIDVDTGSYANVRRMLKAGKLPRHDAVRPEELINYFSYDYPTPDSLKQPFSIHTEMMQTPWNSQTHLLKIGLKGYDIEKDEIPSSNLVFLIDVSGSMNQSNKLPLLKNAFKLLVNQMSEKDTVSIVVYAGASGVVLEPTSDKAKIIHSLDKLSAGGSTHGSSGIQLAYKMASQGFIEGGINRVILATDGDFNVGMTDQKQLENLIENKRKSGIALTTLGFGQGNYNEYIMEQLANKGNGNYAYIDSLLEAQKVLVQERTSTLLTIAKDVKIQLEFNPNIVAEYRLIGYENRALKREDFNNDRVDAGEIGAGHTVTALYELVLQESDFRFLNKSRYQSDKNKARQSHANEIGYLRIRYKAPDSSSSNLIESSISLKSALTKSQQPSSDMQFAAAVANFGQQLKGGKYLKTSNWDSIISLAKAGSINDRYGYRGEFIRLLQLASALDTKEPDTTKKR